MNLPLLPIARLSLASALANPAPCLDTACGDHTVCLPCKPHLDGEVLHWPYQIMTTAFLSLERVI